MSDPIRKGRQQLILLASVFLGPLLIAFVFFYGEIGWRPVSSTANGQLINPPRLLPDMALLPNENGESPRFHGKWSLVIFGDGDCDENCRTRLHETRQVRKVLNRDQDRVQRVLYVTGGSLDTDFIKTEHPGLVVIEKNAPVAKALLEAISNRQSGDVFLVDPIGNLMMRFPRDTGMKGIHTDLKQLLKLSRIG